MRSVVGLHLPVLDSRLVDPLHLLADAVDGYPRAAWTVLGFGFDVYNQVLEPLGTAYSYPPRGDELVSMAGRPSRPEVGAQIYNQAINTVMVAKFTQGNEKLDDVIKWASNEVEGTLRV